MPDYLPVNVVDTTGFTENPMPMKLKGPVNGLEYWAIIFNYLKPEVTIGLNTKVVSASRQMG
jgi:hypothetical protein